MIIIQIDSFLLCLKHGQSVLLMVFLLFTHDLAQSILDLSSRPNR